MSLHNIKNNLCEVLLALVLKSEAVPASSLMREGTDLRCINEGHLKGERYYVLVQVNPGGLSYKGHGHELDTFVVIFSQF